MDCVSKVGTVHVRPISACQDIGRIAFLAIRKVMESWSAQSSSSIIAHHDLAREPDLLQSVESSRRDIPAYYRYSMSLPWRLEAVRS